MSELHLCIPDLCLPFLKIAVGGLQPRVHLIERTGQTVKLIRGPRRTPLESKRRLRTAKIVSSERRCYRGEVTCDQPMDDKEDEKGDKKRLYGLANHDNDRGVEKPPIDPVERGFDCENAEQLFGAAIRKKF
jgi:hypothetical protein